MSAPFLEKNYSRDGNISYEEINKVITHEVPLMSTYFA